MLGEHHKTSRKERNTEEASRYDEETHGRDDDDDRGRSRDPERSLVHDFLCARFKTITRSQGKAGDGAEV